MEQIHAVCIPRSSRLAPQMIRQGEVHGMMSGKLGAGAGPFNLLGARPWPSYQLTVRRHLWAFGIMAHRKLLRLRARSSIQKSTGWIMGVRGADEAVALALMIGKDPQVRIKAGGGLQLRMTNSGRPT
jgi:hypothetical protein